MSARNISGGRGRGGEVAVESGWGVGLTTLPT